MFLFFAIWSEKLKAKFEPTFQNLNRIYSPNEYYPSGEYILWLFLRQVISVGIWDQ